MSRGKKEKNNASSEIYFNIRLSSAHLQVFVLIHHLNVLEGCGVNLQCLGVERHLHGHKLAEDLLQERSEKI